ncbi:MAG: hypothetical protein ACPG4K_13595, partial [Haloferula sp.]
MTFSAPEWFLLLPAALLVGWLWRELRLFSPLRLLILILGTLLLAEPRIVLRDNSLDLWVLLDRSDSTEELVDVGLPEWERLLKKSKPSRRDRMILLDYAAEIDPHDEVVEQDGARVMIAPMAQMFLFGTEI